MNISVIIPTLNAGAYIENLLSEIIKQDSGPSDIIIIDSSSEDNTVSIAKKYGAKTITIPRRDFDHGKTRNTAAMKAGGEVLVFMTQDALPYDNTLLTRLTAPLKDNGIAAAYGRHIPRHDASLAEKFARQFNYPEKGLVKAVADIPVYGIKTFFFSNVCSAFKKELFFNIGMFPEGIRLNEDMMIAARLILKGYKTAYVPEAKVYHSHNYSILDQFRRYYNIGSSIRQNRWLLNHTRPEGDGMKFIKEQLSFVLREKEYSTIPHILIETISKYAGYRIGLIAG